MMGDKRYFHLNRNSIEGRIAFLSEKESHHLTNVSRIGKGEAVGLLDGRGGTYRGVIEDSNPRRVSIKLTESKFAQRGFMPDLALAVIKGSRMDLAVEKCSEIGVGRIIPFLCRRSVWRGGRNKRAAKRERLQRKVVSACKQAVQPYFAEVLEPVDFDRMLFMTRSYSAVFLARRGGLSKGSLPGNNGSVLGIVGPEGGFSDEEMRAMEADGATTISLGDSRLRSETAAICLIFHLRYLNNIETG